MTVKSILILSLFLVGCKNDCGKVRARAQEVVQRWQRGAEKTKQITVDCACDSLQTNREECIVIIDGVPTLTRLQCNEEDCTF
jgi:hypothetical protein